MMSDCLAPGVATGETFQPVMYLFFLGCNLQFISNCISRARAVVSRRSETLDVGVTPLVLGPELLIGSYNRRFYKSLTIMC